MPSLEVAISVRNVTAFRFERFIVTAATPSGHFKLVQVLFRPDGSLFVNFPYFRHRTGILAAATVPGTGQPDSHINLQVGGKVASHLVKYSHHPDGRAHFSQDRKVLTRIKRQSVPLATHDGHLFTVIIRGLGAFDAVTGKDTSPSAPGKRFTLTFDMSAEPEPEALKVVGRWYCVHRLQFGPGITSVGPLVPAKQPDGTVHTAAILANPAANTEHVLIVTCERIPAIGPQEMLMFIGGFDPPNVVNDTSRDAGVLAFIYPAEDADELKRTLGTIDFSPS